MYFYFSLFLFASEKASSAGHTKSVFSVKGKEAQETGILSVSMSAYVRDSKWKVNFI